MDSDALAAGITSPALDRMRLAYMTVAMRDPNPVHLEDEAARRAGLPSHIAHGTFAVAYLAATVSRLAGIDRLRELDVRLVAPVLGGDRLQTSGEVQAPDTVAVVASRQDGTVVARGTVRVHAEDPPPNAREPS
jgi:acyl dehydratase